MTQGAAPPELQTIADFIRWGASRFREAGLAFGHGTDNAIDEAAALVLHALHLPPDLHAGYFPCRLTAAERGRIAALVERRVGERLPLAYLTGEGWFCGLPFHVNEHVLVPRSPLAEVVEQGFVPWVDPDAVERVADVGTGSGCIAVATALALPDCRVDALDNDPAALAVAERNIHRHGVGDRVRALVSDLLAAVPAEPVYDVIVSNPPYVDAEGMAALPAEYRHEPAAALAGGEDGLALVRPLLEQAASRLHPEGVLICEVGHGAAAMSAAFPELPLTWLELERGGTGVFVIGAEALRERFTG